jgi:hypothetical protein
MQVKSQNKSRVKGLDVTYNNSEKKQKKNCKYFLFNYIRLKMKCFIIVVTSFILFCLVVYIKLIWH